MTNDGTWISPGRTTAVASLIRSPDEFGNMGSGTVLVAPTTTPAWTPLFARAAALVTDIGGNLSHGSMIARDYGIPAVMGTGTATQRIAQGEVITVDGDRGEVHVGGPDAAAAGAPSPWRAIRRSLLPAGLLGGVRAFWRVRHPGEHSCRRF